MRKKSEKQTSRKRSMVWKHFTAITEERALCNFCRGELSYKGGTTSNLQKHLRAKHSVVTSDISLKKKTTTFPQHIGNNIKFEPESIMPTVFINTIEPKGPARKKQKSQDILLTNGVKPTSVIRQKRLNDLLLKMIVKDIQPFSIVEDEGFMEFVTALDASYCLPSKSTLSKEWLPTVYNTAVADLKLRLQDAEAVTLTTDGWTSLYSESYIAITAHFITSDFTLDSCLLDCYKYSEWHTTEYLASEFVRVVKKWEIADKVQAVVSGGSTDITTAISLTGYTHLFCFAHTLNLVVQNGVKAIKPLHEKVKAIVKYFNYNTSSTEKLQSLQKQMRLDGTVLKLKDDMITRWNTTYEMFCRLLELQEPLDAAIDELHRPVEPLYPVDWNTLNEVCRILKPFDTITKEISHEHTVTASKIIVLVNGLMSACHKIRIYCTTLLAFQLLDTIENELQNRFGNCEMNITLARATFLDPRFKKIGFNSDEAFNATKDRVISDASAIQLVTPKEQSQISNTTTFSEDNDEIWSDFDLRMTSNIVSPHFSATLEIRRYLEEPHIPRNKDPLMWWKDRINLYPRLALLTKKELCMLATSVPSKQIFTKSGQLYSERRSRLSPKYVQMMMFLNANLPRNKIL